MTYHTPRQLHKLEHKQLGELKAFLEGILFVHLQNFAGSCIESITEQLVELKPEGTNEDYYQWGIKQGALKTHKLYRDLLTMVNLEIERRKELPAIKD